jgi:putative oxidoreductase
MTDRKHDTFKDIGILLLRFGAGPWLALFHGFPKLMGGPELWTKLGGSMGAFGITFAPEFWGFMSMLAELGAGIFLTLGLFTRLSGFVLVIDMIVASSTHFVKLDPWTVVEKPLMLLAVFLALVIMGGGRFSLDHIFFHRRSKQIEVKTIEPVFRKAS